VTLRTQLSFPVCKDLDSMYGGVWTLECRISPIIVGHIYTVTHSKFGARTFTMTEVPSLSRPLEVRRYVDRVMYECAKLVPLSVMRDYEQRSSMEHLIGRIDV